MQKIIGVTELQRKFRPFFEGVVRKRTPLILTRGSRPKQCLSPTKITCATSKWRRVKRWRGLIKFGTGLQK